MLGDSILKTLEGCLLNCFRGGGIGKSEDVLGEGKERILCVLRV